MFRKILLLICSVLLHLYPYAEELVVIEFAGFNPLHQIDSIRVYNVSKLAFTTLTSEKKILLKKDESNLINIHYRDSEVKLAPNPVQNTGLLSWNSLYPVETVISFYSFNGTLVYRRIINSLQGRNEAEITLKPGIYLITVDNGYKTESIRALGIGSNNYFVISQIKSNSEIQKTNSDISSFLPFSPGDKLLYKAYSGNMTTLIPDSPTESKTIEIDFYECKDTDGNHYPVVVLGKQVWMAENLNTTKFRNAEQIPELQASAQWAETNNAARSFYQNDYVLTEAYGQLYNYKAITDSRFLAPEGWRIPTDADFLSLDTFLINHGYHYNFQEYNTAASVAATNFLWDVSQTEGTPGFLSGKNNSSGFGALPAGYRNASGDFVQKRKSAAFWTMTPYGNAYAWNRKMYHDRSYFSREIDLLQSGFSVRCLRPVAGQTEAPVIYTDAATKIGSASASVKTILFSDGGNQVTETGVCWSTGPEPKITDNKMANDAGASTAIKLSGLKFNTRFYVRAFVISGKAVYYGNEIAFNTLPLKVFDHAALPEIRIQVSTQEWNKLLQYFDQNPHNEEKVVSKFSFTSDGYTTVVEPVGLRLRGNTSRRRPEGSKGTLHNASNPDWHHASFSVDMNEYVSGQRFAGLRRVNLKWFKDDSMYAREIYCYDLFRRFGVWTSPQSSYCKLYIHVAEDKNPAYFGVYELLESVDTDYVSNRKQQFGDDKGFLWKAFWGADFKDADANKMGIELVTLTNTYKPVYDLKNRPAELDKAKTELLQFIRDLNQKQGLAFETWIESKTDVELLLKTYAVNVMCGMWDDYWNNKNNFYFYFNSQGKFFFIPYDYDNTLGTSLLMDDSGRRDLLNWGNNSHPLIYKVLQIQKYRNMYINFLHELADEKNDLFHVNRSRPRIQQWHQLIRDYIANDTGEDMVISDKPASWGNCSFYRLLETGNNYFVIRSSNLPARN